MAMIVSDTSPLRAMANLQRLDLPALLFGEVFVPPAVAMELANPPKGQTPIDVSRVVGVRLASPIDTNRISTLREILHSGESEAIALALELGDATLLVDDADARIVAKRLTARGESPLST